MTSPLSLLALLATLIGCGSPPPDPGSSPEGRLCGRAYGSTVDSLEDMFTQAGRDMPEVMTKKDYVKMCVDLGFTEAQLKCMDPKLARGDESCKETLAAVKDKTGKLATALLPKKDEKKDAKEDGAGDEDKKEDEPEGEGGE